MRQSEVDKLVAILAANAPQHPVTDATFEAWYLAMDDVPYQLAEWAAREWIRNHKWFPFPSELRQMAVSRLLELPPPDIAWRTVLERMRATYPGFDAPAWDAPKEIRDAVASMGGMLQIRLSTDGLADEKRFAEIYSALCDRRIREANVVELWQELEPTIDHPTAIGA